MLLKLAKIEAEEKGKNFVKLLEESIDKAKEYDSLTERLGCPIDVYIKLTQSSPSDIVVVKPEEISEAKSDNPFLKVVQSKIEFQQETFSILFELVNLDSKVEMSAYATKRYIDYQQTWFFKDEIS